MGTGRSYAVYGAGRVGVAAVYDLVKHCHASLVIVVEPDEEVRAAAEERLIELLHPDYYQFCFTPSHMRNAALAMGQADIAISCAPYTANYQLAELAREHKTPFLDLGGNPAMVKRQEELGKSNIYSSVIMPECGISPGISNMLAADLARRGYTDITVRCGGIPNTPSGGFAHKIMFSSQGLISEYSGVVPIIYAGEIHYIKARSTVEKWRNCLEASPTSNNSPQVVDALRRIGVRNYNYMTLRHPGHWNVVEAMENDGNLTTEYLEAWNEVQYDPERDEDMLILEVEGSRGEPRMCQKQSYCMEVAADQKKTKFSAMELTTAWGITITANMVLDARTNQKKVESFMTPEQLENSGQIWEPLRKRVELLKVGKY
jgi:saccharopine dehydrogenase-like NADP-dependent oxidoreductase